MEVNNSTKRAEAVMKDVGYDALWGRYIYPLDVKLLVRKMHRKMGLANQWRENGDLTCYLEEISRRDVKTNRFNSRSRRNEVEY